MKKDNTHIIRTVRFAPKTNDGPLECSCGDEMPASEFNSHRKEMNAPKGTSESDLPTTLSVWRRSVGGRKV